MIPMKKMPIISAVVILIILSSCGGGLKLKNDGSTGNLIDEENGLYYIYCLGYLRAAEIRPQVYAVGDQGEKLFALPDIDPRQWLSENIAAMGVPFLFREQSVDEPTLEGFETEVIYVTMSEEITIQIKHITEKDVIDVIVGDFLYGEAVPLPEYITDSLTLNFGSEKYKGIYYILEYIMDHQGKYYIYDRWTGRCVLCSIVF